MNAPRVAVIGGGIAGLAAADRLARGARTSNRPLVLTVLEAGAIPGGHATTIEEDGFLVEAGPNGFLHRPREPRLLELVRSLGLEAKLLEASADSKRRFVLHRGRLRRAPDSPPTLVTTDALSLGGKLRAAMEPWIAAGRDVERESVHAFAERRVGREAADVLVDPAIAGISAGDSRRLGVADAFPQLVEMEREHGSLVRAMIARRREGRSRLLSFESGMATLIRALAARLVSNGGTLRCGAPVRALSRDGGAWRLTLESGEALAADRVVLALPAARAAGLLRAFDAAIAGPLAATPDAGLSMVALACRAADTGPLEGYGYLVTAAERMSTLGVLWESSIFAGRAPQGFALLRVMMGGARQPDAVTWDDARTLEAARAELARAMGLRAEPVRTWIRRWPGAIAQYEPGHRARIALVREALARHDGLELCGSSYDGVSFANAAVSGLAAADRVLEALGAPTGRAPAAEPGAAVRGASAEPARSV